MRIDSNQSQAETTMGRELVREAEDAEEDLCLVWTGRRADQSPGEKRNP